MKVSTINTGIHKEYSYNTKEQSQGTNNINFGSKKDVLIYAINQRKTFESNYFKSKISKFLEVKRGLSQYTKPFKRHKMDFLYELSRNFYLKNYEGKIADPNKEKNLVFAIYDKVKYPEPIHLKIASKKDYSLEEIGKIFDYTNESPEKLKLVESLNKQFDLPYKKLEGFLSSEKSKEIAKNYNDYEPFIKLNINEENPARLLEAEIQKGYNKEKFQARLKINELTKEGILQRINKEELEQGANTERLEFLDRFRAAYNGSRSDITTQEEKEMFQRLYTSTTPQNLPLRKKVLRLVQNNINLESKHEKAPLEQLEKVFKQIYYSNAKAKDFLNNANTKEISTLEGLGNAIENHVIGSYEGKVKKTFRKFTSFFKKDKV